MIGRPSNVRLPEKGRNSGNGLQNYLSHNEKLMLDRQKSANIYDGDYAQVLEA